MLAIATIVCTSWFVLSLNSAFSQETPVIGGTIVEGIVGVPRFVNPTLALTRADHDLTTLMYRGLMRIDPTGQLVPDAAESVAISEDGTEYTFIIDRDVRFHDGRPLTSRDVAYTIQLIQDPDLKSPLRGTWTNVTVIEDDEYTVRIILSEAYAPFIENFTLGILPAHLWSSLTAEEIPFSHLNTEPIGSGPFRINSVVRNATGQVVEYRLTPAPQSNQNARLQQLTIRFFVSESELQHAITNRAIDASAYFTDTQVPATFTTINTPLPRLFSVFFNENRNPALQDSAARQALALAIDRNALIATALQGAGVPTSAPVFFSTSTLESLYGITSHATSTPLERATEHLRNNNWTREPGGPWRKNLSGTTVELEIRLKTSNTDVFAQTASALVRTWEELGVRVTLEQYDQSSLVQTVIRPRDFEALLFGLDINRSEDLFPFWHSSQISDPGLNIAQYTNVRVDDLLNQARVAQADDARRALLATASDIIVTEAPAVFLFQPTFQYTAAQDINLPAITAIARPADRFMNLELWHRNRANLWPWFQSDIQ